jgi:hypothetical protein
MSAIVADIGLSALRKATSAVKGAGQVYADTRGGSDSLVAYTGAARVEPFVLLDNSLLFDDMTPDVMQSILSIFSGYYLQAWSLSAQVGNIEVIKALDKLNPNRGWHGAVMTRATENYHENTDLTHRLPVCGDPRFAIESESLAMESNGTDNIKHITEAANLSVGKMLSVQLGGDKEKTEIQVAIRLMVNTIPDEGIINILAIGNETQTSFKERYHQWKSGQIEFFKDLVLCQDLIDAHKKNLLNDKTGMFEAIRNRASKNLVSSILSGNYSVATASNIAVISSDTASKLEATIGGRLKDFRTRQGIFEKTYLMLMVVVDRDYQRITIYTRGIPEYTSASARDLKNSSKGSGPDVGDILAAYKVGNSPSL